jgi:hypothetical protein
MSSCCSWFFNTGCGGISVKGVLLLPLLQHQQAVPGAGGHPVVVVGHWLPPHVHWLVLELNNFPYKASFLLLSLGLDSWTHNILNEISM